MKLTSVKKQITAWIPKYAIVPILLMVAVNFLVYAGTRPITNKMLHYDISGQLDYCLPFLPVFVIPYILAYLQWIIGYVMVARYDRGYCYRVIFGEILSKLLIAVIFLLFPTTMLREEVFGQDLFSKMVIFLYKIDAPTNLFPSIHCLESYICMKTALEMKNISRKYQLSMCLMSILVFMSTVFIKQHVILDFVGAVIVAETGRMLSELYYSYKEKQGLYEERGNII